MILSAILSKPNQSPYDTLIIDVGTQEGLKTGDTVFALGNVPIGRIDTDLSEFFQSGFVFKSGRKNAGSDIRQEYFYAIG